jgi:hypothetical protein
MDRGRSNTKWSDNFVTTQLKDWFCDASDRKNSSISSAYLAAIQTLAVLRRELLDMRGKLIADCRGGPSLSRALSPTSM